MSRTRTGVIGRPFAKGHDPRRHALTKEERRRGFERTFSLVLLGAVSQRWLAGRVKATSGHNSRY